jgi:hypothetical protein
MTIFRMSILWIVIILYGGSFYDFLKIVENITLVRFIIYWRVSEEFQVGNHFLFITFPSLKEHLNQTSDNKLPSETNSTHI